MTPPDIREIAQDDADSFIAKWSGVAASELSTSQSFLIDLCRLLGVEAPHPTPEQDYMFERPIVFAHGDGSTSAGRIDLYRRGAFVLESKKLKAAAHTRGFDQALLRARSQAEQYARALPADEGRPPFVVVVDVGNRIELYAEFSRSGGTYTPFPDPRSHRIALADLRDATLRERLRSVWTDPLALDPSRESARVTRAIAERLAELAKSLEAAGHGAEQVAQFLMRCLFTMFAEDVRLLPKDSFRDLLIRYEQQPDVAMRMLAQLWRDMDNGGFSAAIASDVLQFNGKLFKQPDALPLDKAQLELLILAAKADWKHVEPAIFGTLLERALSPKDRHKLGAHYTPRAYVERLVLPTVIEPLRTEWRDAQAAAMVLDADGQHDEAVAELRRFHHRLCTVRVLDPACGSGNFLYVTLEHLKRLEGEVLNALDELGDRQTGLALAGERADAAAGETVDPHNLLGIELNPRAAAIAEVVLWIGYLQWHFRTRGDVNPPIPVVRDFRNIECRDAVLAYDRMEYVLDERGVPVTRWDGETMKVSPITGEKIPDDTARKPVERYINPRRAAWPDADFVVGNPPFIGTKRMRTALGEGYVEALRDTWSDVPESADLVMYWWHHAALLTRRGALERFGLITTNSIRQAFNRRVIEAAMAPPTAKATTSAKAATSSSRRTPGSSPEDQHRDPGVRRDDGAGEQALSLVFAIPDHPWVDVIDGASVRIAMTVAIRDEVAGSLREVTHEIEGEHEVSVVLREKRGRLNADLMVGADVSSARTLRANTLIAGMGIALHGAGFILEPDKAAEIRRSGTGVIKAYLGGRDLLQSCRERYLIDFFGMNQNEARAANAAAYQHVVDYVKPEREHNNRRALRELWWRFGWERPVLRQALKGLSRYIVTTETSKHRAFQFIHESFLADHSIVCIGIEDSAFLGVLSSETHIVWALNAGGTLEDRPRYNKSRCFDPYPFPVASELHTARIRTIAEDLDTHRKRQQAAHPDLTLTGMYNVLEKLRSGETLSAKERTIHEQGLVSVLRQIHDDLDAAVLDAYGWSDLLPLLRVAHGNDGPHPNPPPHAGEGVTLGAAEDASTGAKVGANTGTGQGAQIVAGLSREDAKRAFDEAVLERLVALNAERAAEEARGLVRWLRPEFQNPQSAPQQTEIETDAPDDTPDDVVPVAAIKPQPWPKDAVAQVRAVAETLSSAPTALSLDDIAARFTARGPWKKRLPHVLEMLVAMGRAQTDGERYRAAGH